jgi:hypothetical protein
LVAHDARASLAAALRGLERVGFAGGGLAAASLHRRRAGARRGRAQALVARARRAPVRGRRAAGARWKPAVGTVRALEAIGSLVAVLRTLLDRGPDEDVRVPCLPIILGQILVGRTCAACGARGAEMPQCGRCRSARCANLPAFLLLEHWQLEQVNLPAFLQACFTHCLVDSRAPTRH